jgi:hypothetical protein
MCNIFKKSSISRAERCRKVNEENAKNPVLVCNLPDGRQLYFIKIKNPESASLHFIYFFKKRDEIISTNYVETNGETSHQQTIVTSLEKQS